MELRFGSLSVAIGLALGAVTLAQPPGGSGQGGFGQGGGGMMRMMPVMGALDANGDGQISAEEIEKSVANLKALDKNKDGKLTEESFARTWSEVRAAALAKVDSAERGCALRWLLDWMEQSER